MVYIINRSEHVRRAPEEERIVALRLAEFDFQILGGHCKDYQKSMPALFRMAMEDFLTRNHYPEGFTFKKRKQRRYTSNNRDRYELNNSTNSRVTS